MIPQHQASVLILSQNYGGSFKEVYVLIGQNKLDRLHLEYFNNSSPTFWGIKWKNRHSMHYTGLNLNKFSRIRLGLIVKHYLFQYKQQWKFHLHCKADTIKLLYIHVHTELHGNTHGPYTLGQPSSPVVLRSTWSRASYRSLWNVITMGVQGPAQRISPVCGYNSHS